MSRVISQTLLSFPLSQLKGGRGGREGKGRRNSGNSLSRV